MQGIGLIGLFLFIVFLAGIPGAETVVFDVGDLVLVVVDRSRVPEDRSIPEKSRHLQILLFQR